MIIFCNNALVCIQYLYHIQTQYKMFSEQPIGGGVVTEEKWSYAQGDKN